MGYWGVSTTAGTGPVITSVSHVCIGYDLRLFSNGSPGSAVWPAPKRVIYIPLNLQVPFVAAKGFIINGATIGNGREQVGIYSNGNSENDTTTSTTSTVITVSGATWTTNQWANGTLTFTSGTASGQSRTVSSNTGTAITVSPAFSPVPASGGGDTFSVVTYGQPGTLLASTTAATTTGGTNPTIQSATLAYTIGPGRYFLAATMESGTDTGYRYNPGISTTGAKAMGMAQETPGSFGLPTAAAPIAVASNFIPVFGISTANSLI